ncbi:MAG: branched-chain amino acid ABC transporter ATP-binding protein [Rhizobiales bacterium 65-9]|nr:ABC transporter ATP-binding protein [Hyphomicrobiales bacterium]OJY36811.1 MAG: branched-chain amino acid ABC transporter ATP-binding protein [Rhizobiales bacterium 65-9]
MLRIDNLNVRYGSFQVLWGASLTVAPAEIVALLGPNGSGKSSIMNAIMGLVARDADRLEFDGVDLRKTPTHRMLDLGVSYVLERRRLFPYMTVHENLMLGAFTEKNRASTARQLEWVESLFPKLIERRSQLAGSMSGGEQQMTAIARGLMRSPKLLLIDEPFLGLAPAVVGQIADVLMKIRDAGVAIFFNEQNVKLSFTMSNRGYLLESGRLVLGGPSADMLNHPHVRSVYLGI